MPLLLRKIFIDGFYSQYSGLFLLTGLLFIGLCPPGQHLMVYTNIAHAAATHWPFLLVSLLLTCGYLYLIVHYLLSTYHAQQYSFLKYSFNAMPPQVQRRIIALALLANALPALIFIATGVGSAYLSGSSALPSILLAIALIFMAASFWILSYFTDPLHAITNKYPLGKTEEKLGTNYTALGLRQLLSAQRIPYLLAKLLSYVFVHALLFVYSDVQDHKGFVMLLLTAVVMGHAKVIAGQYAFDRHDLRLWANLPTPLLKRSALLFLRFVILFLPEAVWLINRYPNSSVILFLVYLWTFAFFIYHALYLMAPDESYLKSFFFLFFFLVMLSPMASLLPMSLLFLAVSILLSARYARS